MKRNGGAAKKGAGRQAKKGPAPDGGKSENRYNNGSKSNKVAVEARQANDTQNLQPLGQLSEQQPGRGGMSAQGHAPDNQKAADILNGYNSLNRIIHQNNGDTTRGLVIPDSGRSVNNQTITVREEDSSECNANIPLWSTKYDSNQIYHLNKSLAMTEHRVKQIEEIQRFHDNDTKGKREREYVKQVANQNADIMTIEKKTRMEMAQIMTDGHKCLNVRRKIKKCRIYISDASNKVTSSKYFEGFIILLIGLNCITLAQSDATREETPTEKSIDLVFNIIYLIEMVLRIFSLGFIFGDEAYLKSYWNILDFICVVTAYFEIVTGGGASVSGLRAFRVLRPLRFVNNIQGLKVIVSSVIAAIPLLKNTLVVLFFFFLIFAIGGLNLFMGMLKQRCVNIQDGSVLLDGGGEEEICGSAPCPEGYYCGKKTLNPNNDVTNFDNIFWALLNVFQCISLEGWSDIMVMYMKAYTPWTFFFFMPMVFIGAFFLLNLTLAVIQSQYTITQQAKKAEMERKKREAEELTGTAQAKADDDGGFDDDDGEGKGKPWKLGVAQFFAAKRAAQKLKLYWKNHTNAAADQRLIQNEIDKQNKKRKQDEEQQESLRRSQTARRKLQRQNSMASDKFKNQKSNESLNSFTVGQSEEKLQKQKEADELNDAERNVLKNIIDVDQIADIANQTIEEEDGLQDDQLQEDAMNFLREVERKDITPGKTNETAGDKQAGNESALKKNGTSIRPPVMAFNDVRITGTQKHLQNPAIYGKRQSITISQKNELADEKLHERILEDLDFDKMMAGQPLGAEVLEGAQRPQNTAQPSQQENGMAKGSDKGFEDLLDIAQPLDLSFPRNNQGLHQDFASENGNPAKKAGTQISDEDSIFFSDDSSFEDHLHQIDNTRLNGGGGNNTGSKKQLRMFQHQVQEHQKKGVNSRLRRMMTHREKTKDNHNSSQSTFLGQNTSALQQQLDVFSNLFGNDTASQKKTLTKKNSGDKNGKVGDGALVTQRDTAQTTMEKQIAKKFKDKQERIKIYHQIDRDYFDSQKPKDPNEFIKSDQKVVINPGVPYKISNHPEIFEIRNRDALKNAGSKKNPFIAAPEEDGPGAYEGRKEETYIRPVYDAYQLKTIFDHQAVKEPELDSDDDEVITLAEQPFETVQDNGFRDYLNHLSTKFVARKSDIKVTSTLSFTLTPEADGFEPAKFALLTADQIWDYIMLKQEYKCHYISSNNLPKPKVRQLGRFTESSIQESSVRLTTEEDSGLGDYFDMNQSSMVESSLKKLGGPRYKLPPNLLSEPLDPRKVEQLSKKEMRDYKLQLQKFDQQNKTVAKQEKELKKHPRDHIFTKEEAIRLFKGEYYSDEEEEDDDMMPAVADHEEIKLDLNRAMLAGKNDPNYEFKIDDFEKRVSGAIDNIKSMKDIIQDPRLQGDHVPIEIREAFSLPKDMKDKEINFDNVRISDTKSKKRKPTWSGQEVLDVSFNIAKSKIVLKKMNKLRVWPKGFYNTVKKVRSVMKAFIRWSLFENFLTMCVLFNTVGMAMDAYDIKDKTKEDLEFMNLIFTWIFIVEMTLKLLARGPKKYTNEKMNLLDGAVVILSIVEIIMEAIGGGSGAGSLQAFRTVRVFRTFRVLRVTRILRALKSMKQVISVMSRTIGDFILIIILMFVFIFIYTLLGRQIFQGSYDFGPGEEMPRGNYETFAVAFVTVFQVLTMENWQAVLFASMRASQNNMMFKTVTAIYYISWIFIGNFILLNLFLAILIDGFAEADAEDQADDEAFEELEALQGKLLKEWKQKRLKKLGITAREQKDMNLSRSEILGVAPNKKKKQKISFEGKIALREADLANIEDMETHEVRNMLVHAKILKAKKEDNIDKKLVDKKIIHAENSIYLFNRNGCFRRNIFFIQQHKQFDRFIMLLIALSSVKLAMNSYLVDLPDDDPVVRGGEQMDFAVNICFYIECVFKIIALGFAMDEGSYLRDSWNKLDFFIVVTTAIDQMLTNANIPALKVLRMLRMIRPLRVISHNPQLKMIVAALFQSVGSIINVSVIVMIIWLMFAIYGMNTFMGMFFYCSEEPYKYNTKWVCQDAGGEWLRFKSNFDDIGQAMMTLFIVASLEGWPDIMYQSLDVTKRDNGPKLLASPAQSLFFIVFILIGSFFFLNFFIGVLFLKYEQARKEEEKGQTHEQLFWQEMLPMITAAQTPHKLRYRPPREGFDGYSWFRNKMYLLVESTTFDIVIMVCIVLNMFQMALDHEGASVNMLAFLRVTNYFFTAVFFIETVFKMYVYRINYFKTGWNKFDFFVVASSLIDLGLELIMPKPEGGQEEEGGSAILSVGPQLARVLRVLRVTRILRLAGKYESLQSLLKTIIMSVDSLFNVFLLLMLIFFIMSVLGNTLFPEVMEGEVIGDYKNFTNFHQSFMLLFSVATGEDWNKVMYDCLLVEPECTPGLNCGSSLAPLFFIIFIMLVTNVMLNLFILVIIQQFQKYYLEKDNPLQRFEDDFEDFKTAWEDFSVLYQCKKMKPNKVPEFINKLPRKMRENMGFSVNASDEEINRGVLKMGINVDDGFIYFHEMLYRVQRAQFVTNRRLRFSRMMTVNELATQYQLTELTLQMKNQGKKKLNEKEREEAFLTYHGSMPVNLFLTKMFYRTSFRTWRGFMIQELKNKQWKEEQRQEKAKCEHLGKEFVGTKPPKKAIELNAIEIEREAEFAITCSSDEEKYESDMASNKNQVISQRGSQADILIEETNANQFTPEIFRKRAAQRMKQIQQKFSLVNMDIFQTGGGEIELSVQDSPRKVGEMMKSTKKSPRKKSMLIVHNDEDAKATENHEYINPNSIAYQNAVLEHKINKARKSVQQTLDVNKDAFGNVPPGASLRIKKYSGAYLKKNDDPLNSHRQKSSEGLRRQQLLKKKRSEPED